MFEKTSAQCFLLGEIFLVKLFLVEDEIAMREGIRKRIDWASEDIEFVGEASDGELAFPMILDTKPDILLTDIKMPFVDGLELSEMVRKELPDTRIMILSGYDEFEYARKAIGLGVTDYLLKPIAPNALLEKIKGVQEKIEEEKEHQAKYSKEEKAETLEQDRLKLFSSLVMNTMSMSEVLSQGKELYINLSARYFCVVLLSLSVEGESGSEYSETRNAFCKALDEVVIPYENCFIFDREEEGFALLMVGNDKEALSDEIPEALDDITAIVDDMENASYYIGVGNIVDRLSQVKETYFEANKAFSRRFFVEKNQIIYAKDLEEQEANPSEVMDISIALTNDSAGKAVENFLKTGTYDEAESFVENIYKNIGEKNAKSLIFISYITMDMYVAVVRFLSEIGIDTQPIETKYGEIEGIIRSGSEDKKRIITYLKNILKEAIHLRDNSAEKKYGKVLSKAVAYIDENFADEDMSLNKVASFVNVSPNHLSSSFSKEMGTTFIEYLIQRRMERAKELLMTTKKRSSEIAYEVGYKDPHYFSYTFKKTQGVTTKEYRARGGEKLDS